MDTLKTSLKGKYLFRVGTTSFIYPDIYSENVRQLSPFVDEIELLFFESRFDGSLPSEYEIKQLSDMKQLHDISYNIHLPTDVSIAEADPAIRNKSITTLYKFISATSVLDPTSYTLHIPYNPDKPGGEGAWKAYAFKGMRTLLSGGIDPGLISVETLDYDPLMLSDIVKEFDLSVCLDIGHVILHGYDPLEIYEYYRDRITIIHLHGVQNGCDHLSLNQLDEHQVKTIRAILESFSGTVSIEVFSLKDLILSIDFIQETF